MQQPEVSVVVPVYNEEESLAELYEKIRGVLEKNNYTFELIFVDDGSTDRSWRVMAELSEKDVRVRALRFSRNFGKSAALDAGFSECNGRVVVTMDADLQDDPEEIPGLCTYLNENDLDLVSGWKKKRHDPLSKTIPSKFFNYVTRRVSGIRLHDFNCGLKVYRSDVVKNIHVYGEMHRYIPVIAARQGFERIGEKEVKHHARKHGVTKFGWERFLYGFLDLISVMFVSKFRKRPMHFFGAFGTFCFLAGLFIALWLIGQKLYNLHYGYPARDVTAQPLFFLALVAVVVGVQLFLAGFLAEMMVINGHREGEYLIKERAGFEEAKAHS